MYALSKNNKNSKNFLVKFSIFTAEKKSLYIAWACFRNARLLKSIGWDYMMRSRLHMTVAVCGTLNPKSTNKSNNLGYYFQMDRFVSVQTLTAISTGV